MHPKIHNMQILKGLRSRKKYPVLKKVYPRGGKGAAACRAYTPARHSKQTAQANRKGLLRLLRAVRSWTAGKLGMRKRNRTAGKLGMRKRNRTETRDVEEEQG